MTELIDRLGELIRLEIASARDKWGMGGASPRWVKEHNRLVESTRVIFGDGILESLREIVREEMNEVRGEIRNSIIGLVRDEVSAVRKGEKGEQGEKGHDGIPGPAGRDGYCHCNTYNPTYYTPTIMWPNTIWTTLQDGAKT